MGRRGVIRAANPLGGAAVPARSVERLTGLFPVMREQCGPLVETLGILLLDGPRHCGVHCSAPLTQLAAQRDFLGKRMLERILDDRIDRLLVEELGPPQRIPVHDVHPFQEQRGSRKGAKTAKKETELRLWWRFARSQMRRGILTVPLLFFFFFAIFVPLRETSSLPLILSPG